MSNENHDEQGVPPAGSGRVRCAIYARSATTPNTESIQAQVQECRDVAASKSWEILDQFIEVDEGKSGSTLVGRTGLQTLVTLAAGNPRPFDCILLADSSRLGRNYADVLRTVDEMHKLGVSIYIADAGRDSRDYSFRNLVIQAALADEIDRLSQAPTVHGCPCEGCKFRGVPPADSVIP